MDARVTLPSTGTAWFRPTAFSDAAAILTDAGSTGRAIAGCTALSPFMLANDPGARIAVDLTRIEDAKGVDASGSMLRIGALTTLAELAEDPGVNAAAPLLAHVAAGIGDEVIRALATVGGNIAARPPIAGELPAALSALDAQVHLATVDGIETHSIAAAIDDVDWLGAARLVAALTVAPDSPRQWRYRKLTTNLRSYGIASLAINVAGDGRCRAFASLGSGVPQRLEPVEDAVSGGGPVDISAVAAQACVPLEARSDALATAAYRRRALQAVLEDELVGLVEVGR